MASISRPHVDLAGRRFGRLLVLGDPERRNKRWYWRCQCDCAKIVYVQGRNLTGGQTLSCGCLRLELAKKLCTTHGMTNTALYNRWNAMRTRCNNPNHRQYHNYGGRGIEVSSQWNNSFAAFLADMGEPPTPQHTLERIDNEGNYEAGNCRWALPSEQAKNKRTSTRITVNGVTRTITEWAEISGINRITLHHRLRSGMAPEIAISTPPRSEPRRTA